MSKPPTNPYADAPAFARRAREFETIAVMVGMYCRAHHDPHEAGLCDDCGELRDYAHRRLQRCLFGETKPTCANCTVHCYKANMRERVRQVMSWAGPRMVFRHPILAAWHVIDGRRPAPALQRSR